jgi:hypothetical protein
MAKSKLRLVSPTIVNRTVTPRRHPNAGSRTREHLTDWGTVLDGRLCQDAGTGCHRTCCGTPAGSSSPTMASIPGVGFACIQIRTLFQDHL